MSSAVVAAKLLPCVAVAAVVCVLYRIQKKIKGPLREGGKIKKILIYPFKSLPAIELSSVDIRIDGLAFRTLKDREFMLVDEQNTFVTSRQEPSLLLLRQEYNEAEDCLEITSNNSERPMEPLKINLGHSSEQPQRTLQLSLWFKDYHYKASFCSDFVSEWFSLYLKKKVSAVRVISLIEKRNWRAPDRFQDACELNFLSEQSVDNLNGLLKDPEAANVSYRNFRPSLVVETKYPFEEDFWARTVMGDVETEFHSRCDRCVLTTINPDTGVKTNKEPLVTLRKFRVDRSKEGISKYKLQPLLSCYHSILKAGTVHVGQTIMVEKAPRELL